MPVPQKQPGDDTEPTDCPIIGIHHGLKMWLLIAGVENGYSLKDWNPNGNHQLPYNGLCQWLLRKPIGTGGAAMVWTVSYFLGKITVKSWAEPLGFATFDSGILNLRSFGRNQLTGDFEGGFFMCSWQNGQDFAPASGQNPNCTSSLAIMANDMGISADRPTFSESYGANFTNVTCTRRFAKRYDGTNVYIKYI